MVGWFYDESNVESVIEKVIIVLDERVMDFLGNDVYDLSLLNV